jgi:hypothetical protein
MNQAAHVSECHDSMDAFLEWIWERDYMAPGGEGNVDRMVAGIDLVYTSGALTQTSGRTPW